MSRNLGALTYWNPVGLFRPVMGQLCLYPLTYNGPKNELVCNKTLIQMSHTKTLKITPTCFDHQIIIRELFDPG
jgi:hypothetical protein